MDKVGPLKGNRYPGGALDDQAAVLALVKESGAVSWALRWALLEIFHCGDGRHLTDFALAYAKIANEAGAVPALVRRAEIVATAETSSNERSSFASAFRSELKTDLHASFTKVLGALPPKDIPEHSPPPVRDESGDDDREGFYAPGIFGQQSALREADRHLEEAERQWTLGNRKVAKAHAAKVLKTAQEGGWGIWGNLSASPRRAEELLAQNEESATDVIRHYAPLIEAERYVHKWIPAQHLIGKVGPMLNEAEGRQLLDSVIDHVRLVVGDARSEIQAFEFLADDAAQESADIEFFRFIVWLCDHPLWLRRDRAAAMLLWLVEQVPELFREAVNTAFSMSEGQGPDVLCGVLDGASARDPQAVWEKIETVIDLEKITGELRHASRMAVLERLATRGDTPSSKAAVAVIRASFTGSRKTSDEPDLPVWARCLAPEWPQLQGLVDCDFVGSWESELQRLCLPLSIKEVHALDVAVSQTFRENSVRPLGRWESKVRHALNLAAWQHLAKEGACRAEAILRIYNPSQPERTVVGMSNPLTDQVVAAVEAGDCSGLLASSPDLLLSYHDMAVKPSEDGAFHLEVRCLLQPIASGRGSFAPDLIQSFRTSELPIPSTVRTPFETCCPPELQVLFFGPFTPAIPLPFFQTLVGAKSGDFIRQNWRYGRRNESRGFSQPEREGCSLSVPRKAVKVPDGLKLVWIIRIDGEIQTVVDDRNNKLI